MRLKLLMNVTVLIAGTFTSFIYGEQPAIEFKTASTTAPNATLPLRPASYGGQAAFINQPGTGTPNETWHTPVNVSEVTGVVTVNAEAEAKPDGSNPEAKAGNEKPGEDKKKDEKKSADKEEFVETHYGHGVKPLFNSLHEDGYRSLFDSLHQPSKSGKKWYDKLSIRGYSQFRWNRTLTGNGVTPQILGDSGINGQREDFSIRRMRLILSGDVSDHLGLYLQPDFAVTPEGSTRNTFFAQLRDVYGDIYIDTDKIHRFRVGLSKVPYGFENLQSSQNRLALDRTEPINIGVSPNERDLGIFYYFTPVEKQKLFRDLVDGGLKGSGNYGIFGLGIYNGQGGSQIELNKSPYFVSRFTYPFQLDNGQVIEASLQGLTGQHVVQGAELRPLGRGNAITPIGTLQGNNNRGISEERVAASFVYYPQPLGFQAEWSVGHAPGLTDDQRSVVSRNFKGGYMQTMYMWDTNDCGILTPFLRYQYYEGGYRSQPNAPFGITHIYEIGVEWQIWKEVELVCEYSKVNRPNTSTTNAPGFVNYRNYVGDILRFQLQLNY